MTTDWSDERIAAYVDGELDAPARAALAAACAADAALAARVEREQALRRRLTAAFEAELDEPLPQRLLDALRVPTAAEVVDLAAARERRRPRWAWPEWGAMAACLAIGLFIGRALLAPATESFERVDGRLLARGVLAEALTQQLASEARPGAAVALPVSFAATDGRYCRSFVMSREALAGLACRGGGGWELELLAAAAAAGPADGVRPAGSGLPAAVLRAVDERIAGEPLGAAAEREARGRGWRR
ncbi:MAG TPA: hypothetical protein VLI72_12410 [Methylibium sp.]|nr:hypothetical protein [Methylibium sp.]